MKIQYGLLAVFSAAAALSSGCASGAVKSQSSDHTGSSPVRTASKIHVFESDESGFNTKTVFYDNGEEVVAFDSQFTPALARQAIAYLRERTSSPITYLVVTHPNPDKFNGISEFQKLGAKVVSSSKTAEAMNAVHEYKKYFFVKIAGMFTEESYPKLGQVDTTFDQEKDLVLGNGDRIELRRLSRPGVSHDQTVAWIPTVRAAVVGDLVHHGAHAWLEGAIVDGKPSPDLQGWVSDLRELGEMLKDQPEAVIYGGRGDVAPAQAAVKAQIAYINRADRLVTEYVRGLGERKIELQGAHQAGTHYKALQALFEREFPTYRLGYMIQFGIYGLVNSKL